MPTKLIKTNLIKVICLICVLFAFNFLWPKQGTENFTEKLTAGLSTEIIIEEVTLEAKSACVFDVLKNEFIFEKNPEAQLPLASLTKLTTALVAKENLLPGTLIEISEEALSQNGDNGFMLGELWLLPDITNAMLIASSNDAAFAISSSRSDFVNLMNKTSKKLDLRQTYFLNPTGLDISENLAGAYGSCKDLVKTMEYLLSNHYDLLEITTKETYRGKGLEFKNTNKILSKLPTLLGGKTGFDDLAGGNLIVAVDKGVHHPIIIVVLGSSIEGRFEDVEKLYNNFVK